MLIGTISTNAIIWTKPLLTMFFDIMDFHDVLSVFMVVNDVFMVFHFFKFTIANTVIFAKPSGPMFGRYF